MIYIGYLKGANWIVGSFLFHSFKE